MKPSEALRITDGLPSECGVVRDRYLGEDPERFVLVFQDDPANWSVRLSIGKTLHHFQWVKIVGQDGSSGPIDTSITHTIPDKQVKEKVVLYFLQKLAVHPVEYANTLRGRAEIRLFGLEDQKLYNQALKIANDQPKFLPHQIKRAHAIVLNLLNLMEEEGEAFSAMTGIGDIPELVSEELEKRGISYVIIRPKMTHPSDHKMYRDRLNSVMISHKEALEGAIIEGPPKNENFSDKKMEKMKEMARVKLINLIESRMLLLKIKPLLSFSAYKRIEAIVNSKSYGSKTKAVLVKAALLSFLEKAKRTMYSSKFNHIVSLIGFIGIIGGLIGAVSGLGLQSWYFNAVITLFGVVSIGKLIEKRFSDVLGWLMILLGFIGGNYFYGRGGMFIGLMATSIIHYFLIVKRVKKIPAMEKTFKKIENILMGKTEEKNGMIVNRLDELVSAILKSKDHSK